RIERDIGVSAGHIEKLDSLVGNELLYHRRIPRRERGRRIDLAGKQLSGGLLGRERKQLAHILIDLIALEQLGAEARASRCRPVRSRPSGRAGRREYRAGAGRQRRQGSGRARVAPECGSRSNARFSTLSAVATSLSSTPVRASNA